MLQTKDTCLGASMGDIWLFMLVMGGFITSMKIFEVFSVILYIPILL